MNKHMCFVIKICFTRVYTECMLAPSIADIVYIHVATHMLIQMFIPTYVCISSLLLCIYMHTPTNMHDPVSSASAVLRTKNYPKDLARHSPILLNMYICQYVGVYIKLVCHEIFFGSMQINCNLLMS